MPSLPEGLPVLSQDCLSVVSRFEESLASGTGATGIAHCLDQACEVHRAQLFPHLLHAQLRHRLEHGEVPTADDYRQRFPEFADLIARVFALPGPTTGAQPMPSPNHAGEIGAAFLPQVPGYEVLGELGKGGMGVVYKARHLLLQRVVALKMIRSGERADPVELERFQIEARALARLQHPHIVQIYDLGEHEGRPFIALEFCPAGSLASHLKKTTLDARQSAALVEILARAVAAAHRMGLIHRDLKPANVLLTADPAGWMPQAVGPAALPGLVPKVTDFGLAKLLDSDGSQTRTGQVMGTPAYMAPEQASGKGEEVGAAADVWALGVIFYELLTGQLPFKGGTARQTLEQIHTREPDPPSRLRKGVPNDLETICLKCLEKDPRRRYAGAAHLAEDLRRSLDGLPIRARPLSRAVRLARWVRRHPLGTGLLAACLLVLLGGLLWHQSRPAFLELRVSPASATVLLDGEPVPLQDGWASLSRSPGRYRLVVRSPGYLDDQYEGTLLRGQANRRVVRVDLTPRHGTLQATSQPEEAEVQVLDADGGVATRTSTPLSLRLPAGRYLLRLRKELHEPAEVSVVVAAGAEVVLPPVALKFAPRGASSQPFFDLMDRLGEMRLKRFEWGNLRVTLPDYLAWISHQTGLTITINERAMRRAGIEDLPHLELKENATPRSASVRDLLQQALDQIPIPSPAAAGSAPCGDMLQQTLDQIPTAKATYLPRVNAQGQARLEIVPGIVAERETYTFLYDVRGLLGGGAQPLLRAIRQSVGQPADWLPRYDPVTGEPLQENPDKDDLTDLPLPRNDLAFLFNVEAIQVTAPWRIQEGVRDYLRKLRAVRPPEPRKP